MTTSENALSLVREMARAHGGVDLWRSLDTVQVRATFGGLAFRSKFVKVPHHGNASVRCAGQRVTFESFPESGKRGVFEGNEVRIEKNDGGVVVHRRQPRQAFSDFRHLLWWDDLDVLYFAGQAIWTYVSVPFVLEDAGYKIRENGVWEANGETWRRLAVRFPDAIHTHCREQVFYVDAKGLIRRHDYTAELFASFAKAAHLGTDHREFGGFVAPTRRRVHMRLASGEYLRRPLLVWIDVHEITPVPRRDYVSAPLEGAG